MTETGTLTDKGMQDGAMFARIDDKPYEVLPFVNRYLDGIQKGQRVEYDLAETGKIKKIAKCRDQRPAAAQTEADKRKSAGFDNPPPPQHQQAPVSDTCTSPEKPADAAGESLKTVEGQIVAIDYAAHKITVKDRAGQQHTMIWPPVFNDQMAKLKQWWFCRITGEHEPDVDLWRLTAQGFFQKPADWPASQHGGKPGGSWQPRNDRAIIVQSCMKVAADVWIAGSDHTLSYEETMALITEEAIKAADALCKSAGVP